MNFMQKLLRRLFPRDGQLRIAVYDDGHAQIQEYCGYTGRGSASGYGYGR